jgi:ribosomal protein L37AE/L43A
MFTPRDQKELLAGIKVKEGETKRIDCPFCGGRGTFTITNNDGRKVWNCYKNSCHVHGATGSSRSIQTIRRKLVDSVIEPSKRAPEPLPEVVSKDILWRKELVEYLHKVNALEAYERGMVHLAYAPKEHRILFYMNGRTGAVGRALDDRKPKWKAFGDTTGLFTCGSGDRAVLVEDAASACAVATADPDYGFTGVAILGTNLNPLQKRQLLSYKSVTICLDNDASKRSILLLRKLEGLVPATVRFLEDDIKWMTKQKVLETLR